MLEFMRDERFSETNAGMFASRVTEFIRGVEGVFEVDDVNFETDGRMFCYSCQLLTEEGPAALDDTSAYMLSAYNSRNPAYASGQALDLLLPLYGISRKPANRMLPFAGG